MRPSIRGALVALAVAASPSCTDGRAAAPAAVGAQSAWDAVTPLAGCWAGTMGSLDMREQWSEAEGGVMLGTTRFYRDGRLVDFEFGMISEQDGVVTLLPYPSGTRSEHGFPLVRFDEELVFENLEHDFPVRIVYAGVGGAELQPRIEGRDGETREWSLRRVGCPG